MHAGQLLGDGVPRSVLLFRQPLDPPDLGKKLADLLRYIPAIFLGRGPPFTDLLPLASV